MKFSWILALGLVMTSCSHMGAKNHKKELKAAVESTSRSSENKKRDVYRHPVETLSFFGVEPDMKVAEISPGGGWYTEILKNYITSGTLYLALPTKESKRDYRRKQRQSMEAKMEKNPEAFKNVKLSDFDPPQFTGPIAPANSLDMVLTFRNVHSWINADSLDAVFAEFYKSLKKGGTLGLVTHRGDDSKPQKGQAKSGYVREDYVVKMAEKAGFKLVGKSEVNANPKDNKDHPKGVWTLPPTLKLKDKDRQKYVDIGESDRMTLKFKK